MLAFPFVLIGAVLVIGMYMLGVYNTLQRLKTQIKASIQEIGNQLKRQASLIPNLQASVKGYMRQEKEIFGMLTEARKSATQASESGNMVDIEKAIDQIQTMMPKIAVAVEDNPEIKSDQTVMRFMQELSDTADKLMYARRTVIDLAQQFNVKLVTFPSNIIAGIFKFEEQKGLDTPQSGEHLETSQAEMKDVSVDL